MDSSDDDYFSGEPMDDDYDYYNSDDADDDEDFDIEDDPDDDIDNYIIRRQQVPFSCFSSIRLVFCFDRQKLLTCFFLLLAWIVTDSFCSWLC